MNESDKNQPDRSSDSLKLWIELIRFSNILERHVDKSLRQQHGQSISRFDALSQLERVTKHGLTVSELGHKLIASKGNITGLVNRMIKDGLVTKESKVEDRRCFQVKISKEGLNLFKVMAKDHATWIENSFNALNIDSMKNMTHLLAETRLSLNKDSK